MEEWRILVVNNNLEQVAVHEVSIFEYGLDLLVIIVIFCYFLAEGEQRLFDFLAVGPQDVYF